MHRYLDGNNQLMSFFLDNTMLQHTGVDGFDDGGLGCGNVDLALACSDHVIGRFGRADSDRDDPDR